MTRIRKTSDIVYKNERITLYHEEVIDPNGNDHIYGRVSLNEEWVYIAALTEENKIWLVAQHRYPHDYYSRELPSWWVKKTETYLQGAQRELAEECWLKAESREQRMTFHQANWITDDTNYAFIATDLSPDESHSPDSHEKFEKRCITLEQAYNEICEGKIVEAVTCAMITRLYFERRE